MAFQFNIPFYAFRLQLHPDTQFLAPLSDASVLRIHQDVEIIAGRYANALQKEILDKGQLSEILSSYPSGKFERAEVSVSFPAAYNRPDYPAFSLSFTYYYSLGEEESIWAIVPVLGLETFAPHPDELEQRLKEAIRLDFTRRRRLQAVQGIISAIWMETLDMEAHTITLKAPTPRELEETVQQKKDLLLPKAAHELKVKHRACYGRKDELDRATQILTSNFQRSLLLVGPSGVGKTALVLELARRKAKLGIKDKIWETTASTLIKELTQDTGWQYNISQLCQELTGRGNILYVRNLMDLFEVGKYEGNDTSIAEYLQPFLSRGELTMITECTAEELAQIEIRSPNYLTAFQRLPLEEPPQDKLEDIILRKTNALAEQHKVVFEAEAAREAIRLSRRFTPYDGMPGRPIRFLEGLLLNRTGQSIDAGKVKRPEVIQQFCEETGLPRFMVDPDIPMNPEQIEADFNNTVYGQEEAIRRMVGVLSTVKAALARTGKPIASLLFVGPTGVGKTELAKHVARFMFGSEDRLTRFDMSEFSSPYEVQRLIGTGFFSDGLLTSAIRKAPFGVLLFDEIEKAHSNFYDLLLQLLSEGRLTDSQGKLVNFCSTIIIMTSNVGAKNLQRGSIGWGSETSSQDVKQHFITEVQKAFRPELFNRIDQIVPFGPLDRLTIRYVVEREITLLREREGIKYRRLQISLDKDVYDYLAEQGYNPQYGARQLQRAIRNELIIPLAKSLNMEDPDDQVHVQVSVGKGQLDIAVETDPLAFELLLEEVSKISHTDHASSLRRKLERMQEGRLYINLLSQLDLLGQQKKRKGEAFWEDKASAEQFSYFMDTREKGEALMREVQQIELALSEACLGAGTYEPAKAERLNELEDEFFALKLELYTRLQPNDNRCCISIHGSNPMPVVEFYLQLIGLKDMEYQLEGIWYRENTKDPEPFIVQPLKYGPPPKPPQEGDQLWGAIIRIEGGGAFNYFAPENGCQRWQHPTQEPDLYWVMISNITPLDVGEHILRKDYYTKRPARRVIGSQKVKDTIFKLDREYQKGQLPSLITEQLDELFKMKLDRIVL
jgi:ATP-dependent Clp protease ATP-binding subunit ClpA